MNTEIETYRQAVLAAMHAGRMLRQYDIPGIVAAIDKANALGPFLDPTLWMQKQEAMSEDKALLEAALPLWNFFEEQEDQEET